MNRERIGQAAAEAIRDWADHRKFAEASLSVREKSGAVIPYTLAPAPLRLYQSMEKQRLAGKPIRQIILKARQVYISTAVAARFFQEVAFRPGQKAMVVSHEAKSAKNIFGYYDQFRRGYKPFHGVRLPGLKRETASSLEWLNDSKIDIATANNLKSGRSFSIRYLHLSEYAFYRDAATLMLGLMNAVPDDPGSMIVVESTANGMGGEFYEMWNAANDPSSGSAFAPVFFGWWEHPEYSMEIADIPRFQDSLTKDEMDLMRLYDLPLQRIAWRRWAIRNKCGGSCDTFNQEFPACPLDAFLFSGRPRFSHVHLSKMRTVDEPAVGELEVIQNGPRPVICFNINPDGKGALSVYKKPTAGHRYTIGADPVGGSDAADKPQPGRENPDYAVACVLDADTGEQVAVLRGRIHPAPFAEYVAMLAEWYLWAYIVPEANGEGLAFVDGLIRTGYPLALIYHRRPAADEQFTAQAGSNLERIGWKTTSVTRPMLISTLDQAIRELAISIRSRNTVQECRTFVIKSTGRQEHQNQAHDDEVFALALAVHGVMTMPRDKQLDAFRKSQTAAGRSQQAGNGAIHKYGAGRYPGGERGVTIRF
jgi:hypothetical protein